jgi:hypothetical protein
MSVIYIQRAPDIAAAIHPPICSDGAVHTACYLGSISVFRILLALDLGAGAIWYSKNRDD